MSHSVSPVLLYSLDLLLFVSESDGGRIYDRKRDFYIISIKNESTSALKTLRSLGIKQIFFICF
uniref:Uncharacterized protein n=1 Tax=Oryzias latipes TaxID=8090 RepID=A0A3B3HMH2_ORYLA